MFLGILLLRVCHIQEKSIVLCFCLKEIYIICDKNYNLVHCTGTEISLDLVSKFEQLPHATEQVFRVKKTTRDCSIKPALQLCTARTALYDSVIRSAKIG